VISFDAPLFLALLALVPVAVFAYVALARWRRTAERRFAPGRPRDEDAPSPTMRAIKAGIVVAVLALVVVGLARPQIGEDEVLVEQDVADVVIVLDVSRSMLASDVEPTRLDAAVAEATLLTEGLRGNRVGLVIFAENALVRAPLTTDIDPLLALLASARDDSELVEPGSDLGAGIRAGSRVLSDSETASRVLVLVSDGEDHLGGAEIAAEQAVREGVLVYTAGAGTQTGAAVPDEFEAGVPVVTRLDENLLRRIAVAGVSGRYVPLAELPDLADEINSLERSALVSETKTLPLERFQWLALAALALLVAELLIPDRAPRLRVPVRVPRPATLAGMVVTLIVISTACSTAATDHIDEGNRLLDAGDPENALESFRLAAAEEPDSSAAHYNAAVALHLLGQYQRAISETLRALPIDDPKEASAAYYNLGNHYARDGNMADAANAYRQALILNPNDEDAKYNLEQVRREQALAVDSSTNPGSEPRGEGGETEDFGGGLSEGLQSEEALRQALETALAAEGDDLSASQALEALRLAQRLNAGLPLSDDETRGGGSSDRPTY
jgi:Ca-activated chloride channel family protein